jgi:SnoaL-like domain
LEASRAGLLVSGGGIAVAMTANAAGPGGERVQEALNAVDINNVLALVMFAYDRQDAVAFLAFFAPGGELRIDVKPKPVVLTGAAIGKIFLTGERLQNASADRRFVFTRQGLKLAVGENRHVVTSSHIERVAPDQARHYVYWSWALPGENGAPVSNAEMGNYRDELVKVDGR